MRSLLRKLTKQLGQHTVFSSLVVFTLASTIAIATSVFSLFDAVFLRPFPYLNPSELVRIRTHKQQLANSVSGASVYDFWDWQKTSQSFTSLAAYSSFHSNLAGAGESLVIRTTATTPELFAVLNVQPMLGRLFTHSQDEYRGDVRKVVLSYGLWRQLFTSKSSALDRALRLDGESYEVIGVMPPGFDYPDRTQVWIQLMAKYSANADLWWKLRDIRVNAVLGRLKSHVSLSEAQADMDQVTLRLAKQFPATNSGIQARVEGLREAETGGVRSYVILVSASVLLVLAIGCLNVASLFMARGSERYREFAIRSALGSTMPDIIKQLLLEGLIYGALGGGFGTVLSFLAICGFAKLLPLDLPSWMTLILDWRVLLFSAGISVGTAVVFGFAPLIGNTQIDLNKALKQGGRNSSTANRGASRIRRGLVIAEVAFSLLLLVSAGLMLRSFNKLIGENTGIRTDHLIVTTVTTYVPNASESEKVKAYSREYQKVYKKLATLPGVVSASAGDDIPYLEQPERRSTAELYTKTRPTRDLAYRVPAASSDVMPGYFKTLGIPLLAGRDFKDDDGLDRAPVAIISRYTADRLFPGRSAVGEQIRWGDNDTYNPWSTVVGVVGNTKWNPAERQPDFEVYWSALQYAPSQTNLLIRTSLPPRNLLPTVRRIVHEVSPNLAIAENKTMDVIVNETLWQHRLWSYVLGLFATLALFLTAVGLYGVMSYLVSRDTREMGIRMAIGSTPSQVTRLVLKKGLLLVGVGVIVGLSCAAAAQRMLAALLYGVTTSDPQTYGLVIALIFAVTLAACGGPAWRAGRIDPVTVLRDE
jgi:putative ABC transport system permease protein